MNRADILQRLSTEYGGRGLPVDSRGELLGVKACEQWPDGLAVYAAREVRGQMASDEVTLKNLYELAQSIAQARADLGLIEDTLYTLAFLAEGEPPAEFYYVIRRSGKPWVVTANQLKHKLDLRELEAGPFYWKSDAALAKQELLAHSNAADKRR